MTALAELSGFWQVAVIGAGPAGLAAAATTAAAGLSTLVVDENPDIGGQIYRAIATTPIRDRKILGEDYWAGARHADKARHSGAVFLTGTTVWSLDHSLEFCVSRGREARAIRAGRVIIATGARERPLPFEGWTLPGVMSAGGGQILLKAQGLIPGGRTVLAGSGPLLWLFAAELLRAGKTIDAVLLTQAGAGLLAALPHFGGFAFSSYALKGLKLLAEVTRQTKVVMIDRLEARGDGTLQEVAFARGRRRTVLQADHLFVHQGIVPNLDLAMAAGLKLDWDARQTCWRPSVDADFNSSVSGIMVVGDGAGIAGGDAAATRGYIAGRVAAGLPPDRALRIRLKKEKRGRAFLDALDRPSRAFSRPSDDTVVCRCECVTAGEIRSVVRAGSQSSNRVKALLRSGMGPCQGRMCGPTVSGIVADARGVSVADVEPLRSRWPVKPLSIGSIADMRFEPRAEAREDAHQRAGNRSALS